MRLLQFVERVLRRRFKRFNQMQSVHHVTNMQRSSTVYMHVYNTYKYFFGILFLRLLYTAYAAASATCTPTTTKRKKPMRGAEAVTAVAKVH